MTVTCLLLQGAPDAAAIMAKTAAAFLKFLDEAALFYKRLVMQLQVGGLGTCGGPLNSSEGSRSSLTASLIRTWFWGVHPLARQ